MQYFYSIYVKSAKMGLFEIVPSVITINNQYLRFYKVILGLHDNQLVFSNKDYQVVAIVYHTSHGR
jgi:hypothetical protein